ncbi:MAG: adenylate/guanylate cyclase domain-containing protein [Pseudomonadota bacterium]
MSTTSDPLPRLKLDTARLIERVVARGLEGQPLEAQFSAFADDLVAGGFPMKRANLSMRTLHPQFGALTYVWQPDTDGIDYDPQDRSEENRQAFEQSPVRHMLEEGLVTRRWRLEGNEPTGFPLLDRLRAEGMTEYAGCVVRFNPTMQGSSALEGVFLSCATDAPDGFADDAIAQVLAALPHMALAVKSRLTYDVARTVSETYLGADAGRRVLNGEIERGMTQTLNAVIWFCDLRGFTQLADTMERNALISLLDRYLETMAQPVHDHEGQILKYMGDGFLATFDLAEGDAAAVCARVLDAAADLRHHFSDVNSRRRQAGDPILDFGLALHVGDVFYGNIGTDTRLDFTVVGPAVNEASRIEELCRPLGRDILISGTFRERLGADDRALASVGTHTLRGVRTAQDLFTLRSA